MGKGETNILRGRRTDRQIYRQAGRQTMQTDCFKRKSPRQSLPISASVVLFLFCFSISLVLGDSGGVVNSLEVFPASLKSLGCFYFRCVLASQWKVTVTVNLRILHCQL